MASLARPAIAGAQMGAQKRLVVIHAPAESITVAAGVRYRAGALQRWVGGNGYRDLWAMPIRVPVIDLQTYDGGLRVTKVGGGQQTLSLRFESAGGTEYVFRLSDKFTNGVPEPFRNTPAEGFIQDAVSAMHPAAGPISARIVHAGGVLHPTAVLMVLPDDPALGAFRKEFAGRLGMLEVYPTVPAKAPGFGGATAIIDSEEMLKLLNSDASQHVNARAYLAARLMDFLINDYDRHPGNWKWARLPLEPASAWQPIARDRDHAFVSYEGWLVRLARMARPSLVSFGDTPNVPGLTKSRAFDGRLLGGLARPVWDSITHALQRRITDSVIDAAARALPTEYQASAPELTAVLKARLAALPGAAEQFYRMLASRVAIHGTDRADHAVITRVGDGLVDVRLESGGRTFFARRFDAWETSEILIYLHDGDDTARIRGRVQESILVRVTGGNGTNTIVDSSSVAGNERPTRRYDIGSVDGVSYGPDSLFDRRPWERAKGVLMPRARDDGTRYAPIVGLGFQRHVGVTPRIGLARYGYGYSRRPYASMLSIEGEYAFKYRGFSVGIEADKRLEASPLHFMVQVSMSELEVVNFTGLGNATIDSGSTSNFFEVRQRQWVFHPAVGLAVGSRTELSLGPVVQHSVTDYSRSPYLATTRPYGAGTFTEAGVQIGARYEWRALRGDDDNSRNRVLVELEGRYVPALLDVRSAFESAAIRVGTSVTLPIPTRPVLVVRAGAEQLYGVFPFYAAAFIGGEGTTRYMNTQRYAGDASLYGTTELRIPIAQFQLIVPLRVGIVGLAQAGRVYDDGSSPGGWHTTTGGGIWFGRRGGSAVATVASTTEPGRTGARIRLGLSF